MTTREDLESYLIRMGLEFQEIEEGMWMVAGPEGGAPLIVHYSPPVVVLRLKVMDLPEPLDDARLGPLYRRLLELNATDIVHGSYGVDGADLILSDALDLETLDFHEFRTSFESLTFAASSHMPGLAEFGPVAHEG